MLLYFLDISTEAFEALAVNVRPIMIIYFGLHVHV